MPEQQLPEYANKVVLVSGAASGIGAEIARAFTSQGANVFVADINLEAAGVVAKALGEKALAISLDVRCEGDWQRVITQIDESFGRLDVLVNNAGISAVADFEDLTLEAWQRTVDINLTGVFLGCKQSLKLLKTTKGSSIVNLASVHSDKVHVAAVDYSVSKAGVHSITKSVALYCAEKGYPVRCNSIKPGIIRTPMLEAALAEAPYPEALLAVFDQKHPMGHIGSVSDVSNVALFLASDKAAYITGTSVAVDGGFLAL